MNSCLSLVGISSRLRPQASAVLLAMPAYAYFTAFSLSLSSEGGDIE